MYNMINYTFYTQSLPNSATAVATLTASTYKGHGIRLNTTSSAVALEFNRVPSLSASLLWIPLSAGGLPAVSASVTNYSCTWVNTKGPTLSSGTGMFIVDQAYAGKVIAIRNSDRTTFLLTVPAAAGVVTLSAAGRTTWGPECQRLRYMGYF